MNIVATLDAQKVIAKLNARHAEVSKEGSPVGIVGYTQEYAIDVHENLEAAHKPGKQAKFLEGPARKLANEGTLGRIIVEAVRRGMSLAEGILLACLRVQRESQRVVPVDTGALKNSAFTEMRKE
jgi:hypothetical protein